MDHIRLGRTGMKVSRLALGTMTFGLQCDRETSFAIMDTAWDAGIDFFDTADVYPVPPSVETAGHTEEIVGEWIAARGVRQRMVLATKCRARVGPGPNDQGLSRRHIIDAVQASLRRLRTDWIDLYQVHSWDPSTPLEETMDALDYLVRSGTVRYIGCSNYAAWQVARSLWISDLRRLARFESVQPRYNLLYRAVETELLPLCEDQELGVIPYNPLAGGLLTGKHTRLTPTEGSRFAIHGLYRERYWHEAELDAVDRFRDFCQARDLGMAATALGWLLHQPRVTAPIIGATRPDHVSSAVQALDVTLGGPDLDELDRLWEIVRRDAETARR